MFVGGAPTTEGGMLSPQDGVRGDDAATRGNVDSGFVSEAPEDLSLLRGTSVESLPGADAPPAAEGGVAGGQDHRGEGVASPPSPLTPDVIEVEEPWDEAKVRVGVAKKKVWLRGWDEVKVVEVCGMRPLVHQEKGVAKGVGCMYNNSNRLKIGMGYERGVACGCG